MRPLLTTGPGWLTWGPGAGLPQPATTTHPGPSAPAPWGGVHTRQGTQHMAADMQPRFLTSPVPVPFPLTASSHAGSQPCGAPAPPGASGTSSAGSPNARHSSRESTSPKSHYTGPSHHQISHASPRKPPQFPQLLKGRERGHLRPR